MVYRSRHISGNGITPYTIWVVDLIPESLQHAFWQAGGKVGADAISALSALAGQDANRFRHFRDAFCLALVAQARSKGGGPQWDEMWSETLHLCDRTEAVFLDRRQVAMNRLTAAAKLV